MSEPSSPLTAAFPKPEVIAADVGNHGYGIYDDAIDLAALDEMKRFWSDTFRSARPKQRVIRGNLRLGEENLRGYSDDAIQCLHRDIDFLWNRPTHALTRRLGEDIHRVRNLAQGFEADRGFGYRADCYGLYISTSCYPTDSGWMKGHTDGHKDVPILQYMACMTHKGVDYERGGLYVMLDEKRKLDVDGALKPGSVVFFDGRLKHGVDPIGGAKGGSPGRIASFAITTFFKKRVELPDLMRRAEDAYWTVQGRVAHLLGKPVRDEY